ncbi:MAG: DUF1292 domain-containing protein [Ruminococcaceae bacterium]|nr:DUF1292 domain-containing protein [Oscillospiraceae bacterium]
MNCWKHTFPDRFLLIFLGRYCIVSTEKKTGGNSMFGSDFMTIVDEDGTEYELEVLASVEYAGATYLAVIPAGNEEEGLPEISILKSEDDEDGEPLLCAIEDEDELNAVNDLIMAELYPEEEEE